MKILGLWRWATIISIPHVGEIYDPRSLMRTHHVTSTKLHHVLLMLSKKHHLTANGMVLLLNENTITPLMPELVPCDSPCWVLETPLISILITGLHVHQITSKLSRPILHVFKDVHGCRRA
ncbi:hypothetical protein CHARACLAT_005677 [Characodon lateralis]|uniref:Uncharacterized protein n=1 Tax=Characodon lateralis TaxID=208331 RepID=A0ABU7DNM8_9TELE|nr:hypothetical protein [Characodon lateralis]